MYCNDLQYRLVMSTTIAHYYHKCMKISPGLATDSLWMALWNVSLGVLTLTTLIKLSGQTNVSVIIAMFPE